MTLHVTDYAHGGNMWLTILSYLMIRTQTLILHRINLYKIQKNKGKYVHPWQEGLPVIEYGHVHVLNAPALFARADLGLDSMTMNDTEEQWDWVTWLINGKKKGAGGRVEPTAHTNLENLVITIYSLYQTSLSFLNWCYICSRLRFAQFWTLTIHAFTPHLLTPYLLTSKLCSQAPGLAQVFNVPPTTHSTINITTLLHSNHQNIELITWSSKFCERFQKYLPN